MVNPIKSTLVALAAQEEFSPTPALTFAVDLAKQYEAELTACVLSPSFYMPVSRTGGFASAFLKDEIERIEDLARHYARSASEHVTDAGVSCTLEQAFSPLEPRTERLVRLARVNDIAILDAPDDDDAQRAVVEDLLFDSGRPVLVTPAAGGNPNAERIAIAWDGSARSARAVGDALPFLKIAQSVFIVTVTGEKDLSRMAPGADLATYLLRHGVNEPRVETLTAMGGDAAERLRGFIEDEAIELVVMGAFVQSRFRQAILGGVTRSLLSKVPAPLLMAH